MALDQRRNQAYYEAIAKAVTPESVVLDLGAGLGVHGFMAASLGAKKVYLVEPEDVITIAREVAQQHGWLERTNFLQSVIEEVRLPEPVDLIVSVFTGNFLLAEDLLPSLFYARDKYLKPKGTLVPSAAVMEAVPVSAPEFHQREIGAWSEKQLGVDFSSVRRYASNTVYYDSKALSKARFLAAPAPLCELDFYTCTEGSCHADIEVTIEKSELCHGWVGWFRMKLGEHWLSTSPGEPVLHWSAAFLPLDPPIAVTAGQRVQFKLTRPAFGDWSWCVSTDQLRQQHSTFLSLPLGATTLKKADLSYRPGLTEKGKAAVEVLSRSDGSRTVEELISYVEEDFPEICRDRQRASTFVRALIKHLA